MSKNQQEKITMNITSFEPNKSVASLTMAELEAFIKEIVQKSDVASATLRERTQAEESSIIPSHIILDAPFDETAVPFWEITAALAAEVPDEIWATVPEDASEQVHRYLYHQ